MLSDIYFYRCHIKASVEGEILALGIVQNITVGAELCASR